MADSLARAVAAGASEVHVHPKTPCGAGALAARAVAAALTAVRSRVRVPVGVATGAWAEPDPAARVARVRSWTVLPDHASVNWHEAGAEEVAAALRVLAEVTDASADTAEESARALLDRLGDAHGRPVLLHGQEDGAWPVLGLATRVGLEDTLFLPDGRRAGSNARLVAEGLVRYGRGRRRTPWRPPTVAGRIPVAPSLFRHDS